MMDHQKMFRPMYLAICHWPSQAKMTLTNRGDRDAFNEEPRQTMLTRNTGSWSMTADEEPLKLGQRANASGVRPHPQAATTPSMNAIPFVSDNESVRIRCHSCAATYTTLKNALGKKVRCRQCRTEFVAAQVD